MTNHPRRPTRRHLLLILAGLFTVSTAVGISLAGRAGGDQPQTVLLTEVLTHVDGSEVRSATVDDGAGTVDLTLRDGREVRSRFPAAYADELTDRLLDADVPIESRTSARQSAILDLALRVVPVLLILLVMVWAVRKATPNGMLGTKRTKAIAGDGIPSVTFDDVAGIDEAVADLREMVQFLTEPERFQRVGARQPRGALLVGPPGTGKTLLARAVAGEARVPFFAVAGSDFVETFVGLGARRVRDLFAQARAAGPSVVFIDEIDAVGRARTSRPESAGDSERSATMLALLAELDGFAASNVLVLAATNRAELLDAALVRPGRFDRQVQVPNPDRRGRARILDVHCAGRPLDDDVDLDAVARQTPGMSGADLANLVNEACLDAARHGRTLIDSRDFQSAVATVSMGRARDSALVTQFDREVTAWHEAGHALVAALLPEADDPVAVTIVPRGPAGGVTWLSGSDDHYLTKSKALAQLTVSLAGRAAEEVLLDGGCTQGAAGDLEAATRLATAMVTEYGMTGFGLAHLDAATTGDTGLTLAIHEQVNQLLREAQDRARTLVADREVELRSLAEALLSEESLTGAQVREVLQLG